MYKKILLSIIILIIMLTACSKPAPAEPPPAAEPSPEVTEAVSTPTSVEEPPSEPIEEPTPAPSPDDVRLIMYDEEGGVIGQADIECESEGISVLDLLLIGTDHIELPISVSGISDNSVVIAIGDYIANIPGYGWGYTINGEVVSASLTLTTVYKGQVVAFYFVPPQIGNNLE